MAIILKLTLKAIMSSLVSITVLRQKGILETANKSIARRLKESKGERGPTKSTREKYPTFRKRGGEVGKGI